MKAILQDYQYDKIKDHNAEHVSFARTVDFTELFNHIQEFANIKCEFNQPEIVIGHSGSVYIVFQSDNIVDQTGAFASILESCRVTNFGGGVSRSEENGEFNYWVSISLTYSHMNGGENGMELCRADYKDGKWEYWNAGERS